MRAVFFVLQLVSSFGAGAQGPIPSMDPTIRALLPKQVLASPDNNCGRASPAYLAPVAATHMLPSYPPSAVHRAEEGASQIQVVVDQDGHAGVVSVARSSGYADLDDAAAAAVKNFRWAVPPRACREMGVQQVVDVDWTLDLPTIAIAAGSPDYPASALPANLSGAGTVLVTQTGDTVTAVKLGASTGSPDLDQAMLAFAHGKIALPSLMRDGRALTATMQFLFRFSADPARPGTQLAPNLPDTVIE